jgi:hypothetical protein
MDADYGSDQSKKASRCARTVANVEPSRYFLDEGDGR